MWEAKKKSIGSEFKSPPPKRKQIVKYVPYRFGNDIIGRWVVKECQCEYSDVLPNLKTVECELCRKKRERKSAEFIKTLNEVSEILGRASKPNVPNYPKGTNSEMRVDDKRLFPVNFKFGNPDSNNDVHIEGCLVKSIEGYNKAKAKLEQHRNAKDYLQSEDYLLDEIRRSCELGEIETVIELSDKLKNFMK